MTQMSGHEVIERYHQALAAGDFDTVIALHAPEVVCWMSGRSIVSGRFQGREALFKHMMHNVLGPLVVGEEDYVKGVRIIFADGPYLVAVFHGGLPNKVGGRYDQYYFQIFRLADGMIQEIVEIFDTVMFEQAVIGHHLEMPRALPASPFAITQALTSTAERPAVLLLAQRLADAVAVGDWEAVAGLLAPDAELAVSGTTPHSGIAPCTIVRLRAVFARGIGWSRCICAATEGAVLVMRSGDTAYAQQYGVLLEIAGDRIGRISIFEDSVEAERFLYGNRMLPETTTSVMPPFDLSSAFMSRQSSNPPVLACG